MNDVIKYPDHRDEINNRIDKALSDLTASIKDFGLPYYDKEVLLSGNVLIDRNKPTITLTAKEASKISIKNKPYEFDQLMGKINDTAKRGIRELILGDYDKYSDKLKQLGYKITGCAGVLKKITW